MNNHSKKNQVSFRRAFGLILPLAYAWLILQLTGYYHDSLQSAESKQKIERWRETAQIFLASIQAGHELDHLIRNAGTGLAFRIETAYSANITADQLGHEFVQKFSGCLPIKPQYCWAFKIKDCRATAIDTENFTNSHKRAMEKVFSSLITFSVSADLTADFISRQSKFVRGVFGADSAPIVLGGQREGEPTPVKFENKDYYLYWRKFSSNNEPFAGILCLFPAPDFLKKESTLADVAEKVFIDSKKRMAAAFLPVKHFRDSREIILPRSFDRFPEGKKRIKKILDQVAVTPSSLRGTIQTIDNHLILRGFYSMDHVFDAVIFSPLPDSFNPAKFPLFKFFAGILFLWLFVVLRFYLKHGRIRLPLNFSFRLFFFLTGALPLSFLVLGGQSLLQKNLESEILSLEQASLKQLASIDEKSDMLGSFYETRLSEMLNRLEAQKELREKDISELEPFFAALVLEMKEIELNLDYMLVFAPEKEGKFYLADNRRAREAKMIFDLISTSIYQLGIDYAAFSKKGMINLSSAQKTWHESLKGLGKNFLRTIFTDPLERAIPINFGKEGLSYFYSTIIADYAEIKKYILFSTNAESLFRLYLKRELDTGNLSGNNILLAVEERDNSDFSLFPFKKLHVLNSRQGRNAFQIMKSCRGSLFAKSFTGADHIYQFFPMSKMRKYAVGAIVSLEHPRLQYRNKLFFLYFFSGITLCMMYVLSAFATGYLLEPIGKIRYLFNEIRTGNLDLHSESSRTDEIGLLLKTMNLMIKGFRKRIILGKFVSATLEKSLQDESVAVMKSNPSSLTGTVLFCDIRDFTTISEKNSPEVVAEFLNQHLDAMANEIQKFGGQIEQFIGDAIVAVFRDKAVNCPESARRAIDAAISMRLAHNRIQEIRRSHGQFVYEIGCGLEHGELMAGTLSSASRAEFIILGQPRVNAEKLEAASKQGDSSRILVSCGYPELSAPDLRFLQIEANGFYEIQL